MWMIVRAISQAALERNHKLVKHSVTLCTQFPFSHHLESHYRNSVCSFLHSLCGLLSFKTSCSQAGFSPNCWNPGTLCSPHSTCEMKGLTLKGLWGSIPLPSSVLQKVGFNSVRCWESSSPVSLTGCGEKWTYLPHLWSSSLKSLRSLLCGRTKVRHD